MTDSIRKIIARMRYIADVDGASEEVVAMAESIEDLAERLESLEKQALITNV